MLIELPIYNLLAYLSKLFFLTYPFSLCLFLVWFFLFAMITNIGVSRCGNFWWSCKWWRWCCL